MKATSLWCSTRLGLAILLFFGYVSLYTIRVNMSVAIVCMTRQPGAADPCHKDTGVRDNMNSCQQNNTDEVKFDWDKKTQGLILGAFFWGYMSTQIAGGWLADRYGGKHVIGWCAFGCGVATLLIPIAANYDVGFLIALRVIVGLFQKSLGEEEDSVFDVVDEMSSHEEIKSKCGEKPWPRLAMLGIFAFRITLFHFHQGVDFPATAAMWANWAPPLERSKLSGIGYAGCPIGNVVSFSLSGLLCSHGFAGGWPSVFYVFGTLCLIWSVVWLLMVHDSPMHHPRISIEERAYLVKSLKSDIDVSKKSRTTPWKQIFTSLPVWAIFVANLCTDWGLWTFLTNIASFMNDVLDIQVEQIGFLSALPYIGFWAIINLSGLQADFLRSRKYATTTTIRKLFNSLGNLIPAIFVLLTGFATNINVVASFLTIGIALVGCAYGAGYLVNPVDIAPRYAGLIMGISNTFGSLGGILAPLYIGFLTKDRTREQWQYVFIITASIFTFGAVFYIKFSSGVIQPWALEEDDNPNIEITTISKEETANTDIEKHNSIKISKR